MKTITDYLVILVFLATIFGGQPCLFAAEEASTIMCDEGVVNIGDMDVDVQDKCGEPNSRNMSEWVYNFGPSQPVYTVILKEGKVVRILEDESGNWAQAWAELVAVGKFLQDQPNATAYPMGYAVSVDSQDYN